LNRNWGNGIFILGTPGYASTYRINELSFPNVADTALSAKPSEIECEVIRLFEGCLRLRAEAPRFGR
jgi:hypothetical protein